MLERWESKSVTEKFSFRLKIKTRIPWEPNFVRFQGKYVVTFKTGPILNFHSLSFGKILPHSFSLRWEAVLRLEHISRCLSLKKGTLKNSMRCHHLIQRGREQGCGWRPSRESWRSRFSTQTWASRCRGGCRPWRRRWWRWLKKWTLFLSQYDLM